MSSVKSALSCLVCIALAWSAPALAAPDPDFHIYLCFGQSNMEGGGAMYEGGRWPAGYR